LLKAFHGGYHGKDDVVDFSVNLNPLGPPSKIWSIARECLTTIGRYPNPDYPELRENLSVFYSGSPEYIVPVNGASEAISALVMALRPKKIVTISPTYGEEELDRIASVLGAGVEHFHMKAVNNEFIINLNYLIEKLENSQQTSLIYMTNPNNPTGSLISREDIEELYTILNDDKFIILDEAYIELSDVDYRLWDPPPNIIIIRSLTKYLALPGLRIGFIYNTSSKILDRIWRILPPWNVNSLANCLVSQLITNYSDMLQDHIEKSRKLILEEKTRITEHLSRKRYIVYESHANFLLLRHDWIRTNELVQYSLKRGIYIRRGDTFRGLGPHYSRISVRIPQDNNLLIEVLGNAADERLYSGFE